MQTRCPFFLLLCATALFSVVWLSGCQPEETPRLPGNPDDLQFEGLWIGNTSQMKLVEFEVQNIEEHAYITRCRMSYTIGGDGKQRNLHNADGLSEIVDQRFSFGMPGESDMRGTFADKALLEGHLQIVHLGQPTDTITFICVSDSSRTDTYGLSQLHFTLEDKTWNYTHDYNFHFPQAKTIATDTGWIAAAEFAAVISPIIELRAGHFASAANIPEIFSIGAKQFSPFAADGFEIIIHDPAYYYLPWTTSDTARGQEGSSLVITETMEINTGSSQENLLKFTANFSCKVYREYGQMRHLAGAFTGYVKW
ncbi:MAG: hypothetical protein PHT43_07170 [Anaerolineaceae bacterium]|jgi:hypothetical protein|nr:hypothetical protein [Anaerolineaceae bacterium]